MKIAFIFIPTILTFALLLAVFTFSIFNVEVYNGDYIANISLDTLSVNVFSNGIDDTLYLRFEPIIINNKVFLVSYYYTNFNQSSRASNQYIICIINDLSDRFSSLDELYEFTNNGGSLRLGKFRFYKGFILPSTFGTTFVNSASYNLLPDVFYNNNGYFPSFYEIQNVFFDIIVNYTDGEISLFNWSYPEGERASFNLYVSPYYWLKGTIFYYEYLKVSINLPIFDFTFPTIDNVSDIFPFIRSIFDFIEYFVDFIRVMFHSTVDFIGSLFYGLAPLKFIYLN